MPYRKLTLTELLDSFSSSSPTPGGGSAAALSSALGASLVAMVARVTAKGKKYADRKERMEEIAAKADVLKTRLMELVAEDAASYDKVSNAFRLPKETDDEKKARREAIQSGMKCAASTPIETMELSLETLALAMEVVESGNPNCITDSVSSSLLLDAGLNSAKMNVCINLDSIKDEEFCSKMTARLTTISNEAGVLSNHIRISYNTMMNADSGK